MMTVFSNPGIYRAWIQFRAEGKLHTVDFTIMVTKAGNSSIEGSTTNDLHLGHEH